MLNINSVLKAIHKDLLENPSNIKVINDEHFVDKLSGVEFHMYDDYVQMTRDKDKPVTISSFSDDEQKTLMAIKELITDPEVSRDKRENYKKHIEEARARFSGWFENPKPVKEGVIEEDEHDVEEYTR